MKVFEAPYEPKEAYSDSVKIFLAGGITNCADWQSEVIKEFDKYDLDNLIVFNPRRKDFDITNPNASIEQIEWEFKHLNEMDIFSMYFVNSEKSVQPICLYELGRHLERMKNRFPNTYKDRIIIGIEDGYSRANDVVIQTFLATDTKDIIHRDINPIDYAKLISDAYKKLI